MRLEPLRFTHAAELFRSGNDEALWQPLAVQNQMSSFEQTCQYIAKAIFASPDVAHCIPFAVVDKRSATAIGSTRIFDIDEPNRKAEIGSSWIARSHWRSAVNTECKLLLLRYLFEKCNMLRVQLKGDSENIPSRAAMERIGARYEGTLKYFRIVEGSPRSVSFYAITSDEWPTVSARIQDLIQTGRARAG